MRRAGRVGRTVMLRLRFDDFTRATRSHTLPSATARDPDRSSSTARALLAAAMPMIERQRRDAARRLGRNLEDEAAVQLTLPFDRGCGGALDAALDEVRDRFGTAAITRAVLLGRDPGFTVPLLPD